MGGIRDLIIKQDKSGKYKEVRIVFGPHYFVEIKDIEGSVTFILGATHHGFQADASEVGGELETIIYDIRKKKPESIVD